MRITSVSFRSFSIQNLKNQQRNQFSNISFQAKIDKTNLDYQKLVNSGYKLHDSDVEIITTNGKISGAAFVQEGEYNIEVVITDDKFKKVGTAEAVLYDDFAEVGISNFYRTTMKHIGTAGYDNLFNYMKKKHPEIKKVKANVVNEGSLKFHTAYGFKIGDEEIVRVVNKHKYPVNKYLEYSLR